MASETDNSLPEWVLDEHPEEYEAMTSIIDCCDGVPELDVYLRKAVNSAHCKLGPKSFMTKVEEHPKRPNRRCSLLMYACKVGAPEFVMYLLNNYHHFIDVNHKEWIRYTGRWILATPLHIARELEIALALIQAGADVNALSCCQLSPLHTCMSSQPHIPHNTKLVELLLSHGANVNAADRFGNTPLMASIQYGNVAVTKLLLFRGADCTCANLGGYTPMHIAIEMMNLELVKEFLSHGASLVFERQSDSCQSKAPPSAFMFTSGTFFNQELSEEMIELLASVPGCPVLFKADAWLLLGSETSRVGHAAFGAEDQYKYWTKAVQLYEEHKATAPLLPPIPEYGSRSEMRTRSELDKIMTCPLEKLYQCLLIQERILGHGNNIVISTLRIVIGQEPNLDSIEPLWFRNLDMLMHKWINQPTTVLVLHRELLITLSLSHRGGSCKKYHSLLESGRCHGFHRYVEFAVKGLELLKRSLQQCRCRSFKLYSLANVVEGTLRIIAEWLASDLETHQKPSEELELFGRNFISQHLVHYTRCMNSTTLHDFLLSIKSTPRSVTVKKLALLPYLLQWGADAVINMASEEHSGYRPLHLAALATDALSGYAGGNVPILSYLLEYGAHLDAVSSNGETALEICKSDAAKAILTPTSPSALMCQAAHAVVAQQIPFRQLSCLPETMKDFIGLHSPVQPSMR